MTWVRSVSNRLACRSCGWSGAEGDGTRDALYADLRRALADRFADRGLEAAADFAGADPRSVETWIARELDEHLSSPWPEAIALHGHDGLVTVSCLATGLVLDAAAADEIALAERLRHRAGAVGLVRMPTYEPVRKAVAAAFPAAVAAVHPWLAAKLLDGALTDAARRGATAAALVAERVSASGWSRRWLDAFADLHRSHNLPVGQALLRGWHDELAASLDPMPVPPVDGPEAERIPKTPVPRVRAIVRRAGDDGVDHSGIRAALARRSGTHGVTGDPR